MMNFPPCSENRFRLPMDFLGKTSRPGATLVVGLPLIQDFVGYNGNMHSRRISPNLEFCLFGDEVDDRAVEPAIVQERHPFGGKH